MNLIEKNLRTFLNEHSSMHPKDQCTRRLSQ